MSLEANKAFEKFKRLFSFTLVLVQLNTRKRFIVEVAACVVGGPALKPAPPHTCFSHRFLLAENT